MEVIHFETVDSTNKYAKNNIENLSDKTVISADIQTNGYGRFKRDWVDLGRENIYMSMVLKPSQGFSEIPEAALSATPSAPSLRPRDRP